MHSRYTPPAYIRLRVAKFRKLAEQSGLTNDGDIADRIGVHRVTVWRLLTEQTMPGESFIAAVLARLPGAVFNDLFEVIDPAATNGNAA